MRKDKAIDEVLKIMGKNGDYMIASNILDWLESNGMAKFSDNFEPDQSEIQEIKQEINNIKEYTSLMFKNHKSRLDQIINTLNMRADQLDRQYAGIEGRINDYQVVIDSLLDGNLGKLQDVIKAVKDQYKDQYIEIQEQVNKLRNLVVSQPFSGELREVLQGDLLDMQQKIDIQIFDLKKEVGFLTPGVYRVAIRDLANEEIKKQLIAWGAGHLNSAHASMDVKYDKLYDLIIGISKEVTDLRLAVKDVQSHE